MSAALAVIVLAVLNLPVVYAFRHDRRGTATDELVRELEMERAGGTGTDRTRLLRELERERIRPVPEHYNRRRAS